METVINISAALSAPRLCSGGHDTRAGRLLHTSSCPDSARTLIKTCAATSGPLAADDVAVLSIHQFAVVLNKCRNDPY